MFCCRQLVFSFFLSATFFYSASNSSALTVSKAGGGQFNTIQAAIDASSPGDEIIILDSSVYDEQVTIDSTKRDLILKSSSSSKPTIRFRDTIHIHPTSRSEAAQSIIDFDKNGALRVLNSSNITIEGIKINGVIPYAFGADDVWHTSRPFDLQHGNAGITIRSSGNVVIRNCDISNAYFGIFIKDDNYGGIYSNVNPEKSTSWNLNGFGRNGDHLIEKNRIHHNSWGIFCESLWDLGSVIRYNLFYENHHYSDSFAQVVETLTSDGSNQVGGSILLKDDMLSPLAIHNNTFWHNRINFAAHWQAGQQHLVFNNIIAQPNIYNYSFMSLDPVFTRMYHMLYAVQNTQPRKLTQKFAFGRMIPETDVYVDTILSVNDYADIKIMSKMERVEVEGLYIKVTLDQLTPPADTTFFADWVVRPGARVLNFPIDYNIRWFEMKFLSTDSSSPNFLVPDWNDPDVQMLAVDQGWPKPGIRDADGSISDLGAIAKGGLPQNLGRIHPLSPVQINGTKATLNFKLTANSIFNNPQIKLLRLIKNVKFREDAFGSSVDSVRQSDIIEIPATASVNLGGNSITVDIPELKPEELYGFFEMTIEGRDSDGKLTSSAVGFIPYRNTDIRFSVTLLDKTGETELATIKSGDTAQLRITPITKEDSVFQDKIDQVYVSLSSGGYLSNLEKGELKIDSIRGTVTTPVIFHTSSDDGMELINVSGLFTKSEDTLARQNLIYGVSNKVLISQSYSPVFKPSKVNNGFRKADLFFSVYTANGRLLYRGTANSFQQIKKNLGSLKMGKGIYFVDMRSQAGKQVETRRIAIF